MEELEHVLLRPQRRVVLDVDVRALVVPRPLGDVDAVLAPGPVFARAQLSSLHPPHLLARRRELPARATHDRLLIGDVLPVALVRLFGILGQRPLEARAARPAYDRVGIDVRRGENDIESADLRQQTLSREDAASTA